MRLTRSFIQCGMPAVLWLSLFAAGSEIAFAQKTPFTEQGGHVSQNFKADRAIIYPSLKVLASRSAVVLVGRINQVHGQLTPDGVVTSEYSIQIQQILKGARQGGGFTTVRMPGGAIRFADGGTAFLYAVDQRLVNAGNTYVFFLLDPSPGKAGYEVAGGMQGVYELDNTTGTVIPIDLHRSDPVVRQLINKPIGEGLSEIAKAVRP